MFAARSPRVHCGSLLCQSELFPSEHSLSSQIDGSGNFIKNNMQYSRRPRRHRRRRLFYPWQPFVTGLANISTCRATSAAGGDRGVPERALLAIRFDSDDIDSKFGLPHAARARSGAGPQRHRGDGFA